MASTLKIKRSSVQGKAPTTSNLTTGELALNIRDGKIFTSDGTNIVELGANANFASFGTLTVGNSTPYTFPTSDGSADQVLKTDGSGQLVFADQTGGGGSSASFKEFSFLSSNNQQSISGSDRYGQSLTYTSEKISVFLNGVLQVANTDYLASNGSSIFFTEALAANDEVTIQSFTNISGFVSVDASIVANSASHDTATQKVVDTFVKTEFRSAKYLVQVDNGVHYQASEVLLVHNGTDVSMTEYATIAANNIIASIDADISGDDVRLLVTPTVANTNLKVIRMGVVSA